MYYIIILFQITHQKNKHIFIWVFPKIGVPQIGWFKMEKPIKMDDLGVPLFSETPILLLLLLSSILWLLSSFHHK